MTITRKDYMDRVITFDGYYGHIAKLAGVAFSPTDHFIVHDVVLALRHGDTALNTIPLEIWDALAFGARAAVMKAMKQVPGEAWSLAGGVCVAKTAARRAAIEAMKKERGHE